MEHNGHAQDEEGIDSGDQPPRPQATQLPPAVPAPKQSKWTPLRVALVAAALFTMISIGAAVAVVVYNAASQNATEASWYVPEEWSDEALDRDTELLIAEDIEAGTDPTWARCWGDGVKLAFNDFVRENPPEGFSSSDDLSDAAEEWFVGRDVRLVIQAKCENEMDLRSLVQSFVRETGALSTFDAETGEMNWGRYALELARAGDLPLNDFKITTINTASGISGPLNKPVDDRYSDNFVAKEFRFEKNGTAACLVFNDFKADWTAELGSDYEVFIGDSNVDADASGFDGVFGESGRLATGETTRVVSADCVL